MEFFGHNDVEKISYTYNIEKKIRFQYEHCWTRVTFEVKIVAF
jgi:hypothetical protein